MKHTITLTEQELLVIVNALHNAAAENRSNYANGEEYEKGNHALIEDANEQEAIANTVGGCLTEILPVETSFIPQLPTVGPFCF